MAKVSVIIPVFNAEQYIEQCLNSVLQQTMEEIEIIVIDDGSKDNTGEILDCIAKENGKIRLFHQSNQGLYKTREIGLAAATGEFVGWVDADDYIEPDMYETLYSAAIEHDSELALCDYDWYPAKIPTKEKWYRPYPGEVNTWFVERNSQPWNKIVKRELLERLRVGEAFVTCFDEVYIQILMEAKNPVSIDRKLYHYRVGGSTMSSSYRNVEHYRRFIRASEALRSRMEKACPDDPYWNSYFAYRVSYYMLMTMVVAANAGDRTAYQGVKKELKALKPDYRKNPHFHRIMKENFGSLKSTVISQVIPAGYEIARLACRIGIH